MLNEPIFLSSFDELKNILFHQLTILHIATAYIVMYVIYKALGRYIYFKPQEHASKINRTFLTLSLLILFLHNLNYLNKYLPFLPQYRWLLLLCWLVILIGPLSILIDRIIWKYQHGHRRSRDWHYNYLPIREDYYPTPISKSERDGNSIHQWEDEVVESTKDNIHSDVLLHIFALLIFIGINAKWTLESATQYGSYSYILSITTCLTISGIFIDRSIFSWISFFEYKIMARHQRNQTK